MNSERYDRNRVPVSQRNMSREAKTAGGLDATIQVQIDGQPFEVTSGTTILEAASANGIHIPTLCTHSDLCVAGNCRICVVKVEGHDALQSACAYPLTKTISVETQGKEIRLARKHLVELMLSNHVGDCYACSRNHNCELLDLGVMYGVDRVALDAGHEERTQPDTTSRALVRNMDKCVLCRRCVRACIDMQEVGVVEAVGKGDATHISTFGNRPMNEVVCIACGQCVSRCPTAALTNPDDTERVWTAIDDPNTKVVLQVSPWIRATIAECFGCPPGTMLSGELVSALKKCGFDEVYDTNAAADILVVALGTAILSNSWKQFNNLEGARMPMLSSVSAGWVRYVEHFAPDLLEHMSPFKSPEQLMAALIRDATEDSPVFNVAAVPCTARKLEADRPDATNGELRNIDVALTTNEVAKMLKQAGILPKSTSVSPFDPPPYEPDYATPTGISSGLCESLGASLLEVVTGRSDAIAFEPQLGEPGIGLARLSIDSVVDVPEYLYPHIPNFNCLRGELLLGKCSGTANAKKVLADIRAGGIFSQCAFIEVSACLDGCIGGGGQPVNTSTEIRALRARALEEAEPLSAGTSTIRKRYEMVLHSHSRTDGEVPDIMKAHYSPRGKFMV